MIDYIQEGWLETKVWKGVQEECPLVAIAVQICIRRTIENFR